MKLFIKKYALPIGLSILSILLFVIFRLVQKVDFIYQEIFLWIGTILSIILIRSADDFFDFEQDLKDNKKTLPKKLVSILFITLSILPILFYTISNGILGLIMGMIYIFYLVLMTLRNNKIGKMFIGFILTIISIILVFTLYDEYFYLNSMTTIIYSVIISIVVLIPSIIFGVIRGKKHEAIHNHKIK